MNKQHILVTGGAGFIGSRLVAALFKANPHHRIWVIDNMHPQVHGNSAPDPIFHSNVEFVRGDVLDGALMRDIVAQARPELVFHLAAETGTGQSYDEPTRYCQVNVIGTTILIDALRIVGTTRRVVLAASRAVYGEGGYRDANGFEFVGLPRQPDAMKQGDYSVPLPPTGKHPGVPIPSHAGLPPAPASVYASTKLMQEYLLSQAGEGASWQATMLRLQNVYGPGQSLRNRYTGVLSIFARRLLEGGSLAIFEDGLIARDFIFVDDVVEALVLAGERQVAHGTILDIGSGEAITILEAAQTLMRALGREEDAYSITGEFRIGDIRHACADIRAASDQLGWVPTVSVQNGLQQLADWASYEFHSGNL